MANSHEVEFVGIGEVTPVTGVDGESVGDGCCGDHPIVGAGSRLASARRSDATTRPNTRAASASKWSGTKSFSAIWGQGATSLDASGSGCSAG
jgi:hypothetical protein